jgi:sialic acid synthase SpsE
MKLSTEEKIFIAEVSSNHSQNMKRCSAFIEKSAEIGCWGIKFQLFKIESLFAREILNKSPMHRERKKWELPTAFIPEIADLCHLRNLKFGCTPFYLKAVEELYDFVDFYKIASYELLWKDLLVACAQTGKPLMLSTGMATLDEVKGAVKTVMASGCVDLTVFHCISGYPAPVKDCNLAAIEILRDMISNEFPHQRAKMGWSDHSVNTGVIYRAVNAWDVDAIEFHLDIDGKGEEFPSGHCWLPEKIAPVIAGIRDGLLADGSGIKEPTPVELKDREWRADPSDGLRPFKHVRESFRG